MKSSGEKILFWAIIAFVVAALCVVAFAFSNTRVAYTIKDVDITAQLETNGTLRVVDQREIESDEDVNVIAWQVHETTDKSSLKIESARLIVVGGGGGSTEPAIQNFQYSNISDDVLATAQSNPRGSYEWQGSFTTNKDDSMFYFFLPSNHGSLKNAVIEVSYSILNSLYIYDDYAEIYWDYFVSDDSSETPALSTMLAIPVLEGSEAIPGKNVWAWGHGPAGQVDFVDGIWFFVSDNSGSSADGRAHVLLERRWLSNVNSDSAMYAHGARKDYALEEEKEWTDGSMYTQINTLIVGAACIGINIVFVLIASLVYLAKMRRYRKLLSSEEENGTALYLKQVEFDERSKKLQLGYLCWVLIFIVLAIICWIFGKSWAGCLGCLLSCTLCLIFCNWMPTIHTSWRDSLLASKQTRDNHV